VYVPGESLIAKKKYCPRENDKRDRDRDSMLERRRLQGRGSRSDSNTNGAGFTFNTTDLSSYPIMHFELRLSINLGISFLFESGFHTLFCDASYSSSDLKIL